MEDNIFLNERMNLEYETKKTLNDRGNIEIEMPDMVKSNMEEPQARQPVPAADGGIGVDISSLTSNSDDQQLETGPSIEPPEKELTKEELAGEMGYGDEEENFQSATSAEVVCVDSVDWKTYDESPCNLHQSQGQNVFSSTPLVNVSSVGGGRANVYAVEDGIIYADEVEPESYTWRYENEDGLAKRVSTSSNTWTIPASCPLIEGEKEYSLMRAYSDDMVYVYLIEE